MPTATKEIFRDDQPLFQGTHKGDDGATTLRDPGANFRNLGVDPQLDLYIENVTQATNALVAYADADTVVATGNGSGFPFTFPVTLGTTISWDNGDTYKIYRTSSKNSYISGNWVDISRGWRIKKGDDVTSYGWRREDVDLDEPNRRDVFGPGQPE
jgi:hypothetical protein